MSASTDCQLTHPHLLAGSCPWCGCPVLHGRPVARANPRAVAIRKWNIASLMTALDHADEHVRYLVVKNMRWHGPWIADALPVLSKALADENSAVREHATQALCTRGSDLPERHAQGFEEEIAQDPGNLAIRLLLLGYYFVGKCHVPAARARREQHVLWIIAHAPASDAAGTAYAQLCPILDEEGYPQAKQLWLRIVAENERNPSILGNAANFFCVYEFYCIPAVARI